MGIPSYFSFLRRKYNDRTNEWLIDSLPEETGSEQNREDIVNSLSTNNGTSEFTVSGVIDGLNATEPIQEASSTCSHLYIDLNGIIHCNAQKIVEQFELDYTKNLTSGISIDLIEANIKAKRDDILYNQIYPRLFEEIIDSVQLLLDVVQPSRLCYLAIDGVAPRAKMVQQRQRRYRAVQDKIIEHRLYHKHQRAFIRGLLWDSNSVTPGTVFMQKLEAYFHEHLLKSIKLPHDTTQVLLSDATEPGEGEHKIMNYMRQHSCDSTQKVIYGQDADLIMLAFAHRSTFPNEKIFVLREKDIFPAKKSFKRASADSAEPAPPLQFIDIAKLEKAIICHIESFGDLFDKTDHSRILRDYIVLCFLLGNDFIPHGPSIMISAGGINALLEAYVQLKKQHQTFLTYTYEPEAINDDDDLNPQPFNPKLQIHISQPFFRDILLYLARQEDYLSSNVYDHILQKRKWTLQQQRYPKHSIGENKLGHESRFIQSLPPSDWAIDDLVSPGTSGWQRRYYIHVEQVRNMNDVHSMCRAYMEGIYWTLQYYCCGCWSTTWEYPYVSAPLLSNMASFLSHERNHINRLVKYDPHSFCKAIEQLQMVLPPESFDTCVEENTGVCIQGKCGELITFGKKFRWECPIRVVRQN